MLREELLWCKRIGFSDVTIESEPGVRQLTPHGALRLPRHARFHPLKYLDGLISLLQERGVAIFGNTAAVGLEETSTGVTVLTEGGSRISAGFAVLATNAPILDKLSIHPKQAPYRTYVLAAPIDAKDIADALYWDTEDPYHYVRLHPYHDGQILLSGGEDHKTGQADDIETRLDRLEKWTRERFPEMGKVRWRWSGQCLIPHDFVGFIGRNPGQERVFVATGDSGQGMTTGVLAGMIVNDLIRNGGSPWAKAYDPRRKPTGALGTLISENVTAVKKLAAHLLPGEIDDADDLRRGQGGLMRSGIGKVAVSKDMTGGVHRVGAACTHSGCAIHWNAFEQCWDCGCHGSHFAPDGSVTNAPAVLPLGKVP